MNASSFTPLADDMAAVVVTELAPLLDRRDLMWQDAALCAEVGGDMFYPEKGEPSAPAKRVCRACVVRAECLDDALEHEERFGGWGGYSERERRRLRRERTTGLPWPARRAA